MPPKSATTDIPKSLFLLTSDDDDSYGDSQPPYVPDVGGTTPSPLPVPDMNPPSDDDSGNNSYDGDNGDGEINDDNHPTEDVGQGYVDTPPENPDDPIELTLGSAAMVPAELAGYLSESLEACFNIPVGAPVTFLPPGFADNGIREGPYVTGDLHSMQLAHTGIMLQSHADDAQVLSAVQMEDLRFFSARSEFIFHAWDTFHACTAISDVKTVLELMAGDELVFLLVLYAAYANYDIDFSMSFGQAKAAFYAFAQQCKFEHGSLDTFPDNTPVSSARPEFFLVKTIPQLLAYLVWHGVPLPYLPIDMSNDQIIQLFAIPANVHARFDLGVYLACTISNYLATVYSDEDHRYQLLHHQLYMSTADTVQSFHISAVDANIFVQSVFKHGQYPCPDMASNFGQQLLYRAFQWITLPHYMASIKRCCSTTWIQLFDLLMTRPPPGKEAVDVTDEACARRLLERSEGLRTMLTLYPQLNDDPALLTDFLQESVIAHALYGPPLASDTHGIQLAKAAGCLIEELQRNTGEDINIDNVMSQSDLLFVLHAGGVYQPDASANRLFASDLFPVYLNKAEFVRICPQLIPMSFDLFLYPPQELTRNRSIQTWRANTALMRLPAAMEAQRTIKLAAFHQAPVFRQDFIQQHSLFDMRQPTRASKPMHQNDFVRDAGQQMVAAFRVLSTAVAPTLSTNSQSASTAAAPQTSITPTHQFIVPPTLLQPRINMSPPLPSDPYAEYLETAMFQWAEQQSITNWVGTAAQQLQYSDYRSKVQLCNTRDRPIQHNDELLLLHSTRHRLDPQHPWDTICYMFQLQYRVVHAVNNTIFGDFAEFFSAPAGAFLDVATTPLKLRCTYNGTYLLRLFPDDQPSGSQQQASSTTVHASSNATTAVQQKATSGSARGFFRAVVRATTTSTTSPAAPATTSLSAVGTLMPTIPPTTTLQVHRKTRRKLDSDSDDDDTTVKLIKDKEVEVDGKRYRVQVQGKGAYHSILIATTSMRTLMEVDQLDKLTAYHGNYVHNYAAEVLLKGILRQTTLQSTLSGMQIHAPQNHALKRFQQLLWYELDELHDRVFQFQWEYATASEAHSQHPIHYLTADEAARRQYKLDHDSWPLTWIGMRITVEQILGFSYGDVFQSIISDIQQNNIGQLFDIDYLVSLHIQLMASLHQYSSQHKLFQVPGSSIDYDPSTMVAADWQEVIRLLWAALKTFLTFAQQQEHLLINEKFKVPRLKPLLPKDKKHASTAVKEQYPKVVPPALKTATPKGKSAPVQKERKVERKVEFEDDAIRYCVQDMARHYRITTSLTPCAPECKYVHYNKLPANLSTASVLSAIGKITTRLGLTESQMKQFDKNIRADKKFK